MKFKFSSKKNLETFKSAPKKYIPAYGGYCAYALGTKGERVAINPETLKLGMVNCIYFIILGAQILLKCGKKKVLNN